MIHERWEVEKMIAHIRLFCCIFVMSSLAASTCVGAELATKKALTLQVAKQIASAGRAGKKLSSQAEAWEQGEKVSSQSLAVVNVKKGSGLQNSIFAARNLPIWFVL
jgi:hypothetical protein